MSKLTSSLRSLICDYFTFGFALWTVASHITVFSGGNLLNLIITFSLTVLLLLIWELIRRIRKKHGPIPSHAIQSNGTEPGEQLGQNILFWILVIFAVCLTLVAHRPDADDTRYVNRAVAVADAPRNPILKYDTRHSIPDVPIRLTSKLISNEMLAGALSLATGIPAITIFHLVFSPIAAMLTIMAFSELFRIIAPKHWAYGVLAVVVFLCANGEVHRTFGNFSFVRLHQGKGILVMIIVPLIITYSLRFVCRPTIRNWLLLASIQISAVGISATGLMIGPTVALLSVLTGILGMNVTTGIKRLVLSFSASTYVLGLGLLTKLPMVNAYVQLARHHAPIRAMSSVSQQGTSFFDRNIAYVFGDGRYALLCLIIILTAWFWCETRLARRLCIVFPAVVGLVFANPLVDDVVIRYISGKEYYWRVFWLLPLPAMAGITLLAPLSSPIFRLRSLKWRYGVFFLLLVLLLGVVSEQSIFSKKNGVTVGIPDLKVPPEYKIAQIIKDSVEGRPDVLVPHSVSTWLPTMHLHPYPLVSRIRYQYKLYNQRQERMVLKRYIMGRKRPANAREVLHQGILDYQIAVVCFSMSNPWAEEIREVLQASGYEDHQHIQSHEIWILDTQGN